MCNMYCERALRLGGVPACLYVQFCLYRLSFGQSPRFGEVAATEVFSLPFFVTHPSIIGEAQTFNSEFECGIAHSIDMDYYTSLTVQNGTWNSCAVVLTGQLLRSDSVELEMAILAQKNVPTI